MKYEQPAHNLAWPLATPGQRVAAFVLDSLIVAAIVAFCDTLLKRAGVDTSSQLLVFSVYFLFMHARYGQTLGKKLVGIKLVSIETGEVPSGKTVVFREMIAKTICVVILFLGYLIIALRKDRKGLHDLICKTQVVSLRASSTVKPVRLMPVLASLAALAIIGAASFYYALMYTTMPLRMIVGPLEARGFQFGAISGSLDSGFTLSRIAHETDDYAFEIMGLSLQCEREKRDKQTLFVIKNASVLSAKLHIKRWAKKDAAAAKDPSGKDATAPGQTLPVTRALPYDFLLSEIDINDVELQLPDRPASKLQRLYLAGLDLQSAKDKYSLDRLYLESDALDLDLKKLSATSRSLTMTEPARVMIKPALLPQYLKEPVDAQFAVQIQNKEVSQVSLQAFRRRLSAEYHGSLAKVKFENFTPAHFFKTELPIWAVNLSIAGSPKPMRIAEFSGSAGLRSLRFELAKGALRFERAGRVYVMNPKPPLNWAKALSGEEPLLVLTSTGAQPPREILADLYFGHSVERLSPEQLALIERDQKFFTAPSFVPEEARIPSSAVGP